MTEMQELAFKLQLDQLRQRHAKGNPLDGCLLAASSVHAADPKRQTAVIEFLLAAGLPVNESDKNGVTALHRAVRFRNLAAVETLLAAGADVAIVDRKSHSTALHRAVTNSGAPATAGKDDVAVEIVRMLLSHGADPLATNKSGNTPMDYRMSAMMSAAFGK